MASGLTGGAASELDRQAALFGVGSDLVVRNNPPLRVHRLRFASAFARLADVTQVAALLAERSLSMRGR